MEQKKRKKDRGPATYRATYGAAKGRLSATRATLLGGYLRDEDGENCWSSMMDERGLEKELVEREDMRDEGVSLRCST